MQRNLRLMLGRMLIVIIFLLSITGVYNSSLAADKNGPLIAAAGPQIGYSNVSVSQPLSSIPLVDVSAQANLENPTILRDRFSAPKTQAGDANTSANGADAAAVPAPLAPTPGPTPIASFDGAGANGSLPPDANGAIGFDPATRKKYYMQWVNTVLQIWDVTNPAAPSSLYGPTAGNTALFSGMAGSVCLTTNSGDPIVLYDHLANRWFASQFAFTANNYHQCIAVSQTGDPMGAWYRYDFLISTTKFNDYPKFGVWPDGYYLSINEFDAADNALGAGAIVFERNQMLSGLAARMLYFDTSITQGFKFFNMLPSDLDGPAPAAGTPNYFIEWDDKTWLGDTQDSLRIWNFHVDWTTPANSTFGVDSAMNPNQIIATNDVNPNFTGLGITQPGTAQKIDAIPDRLMYRLQYRNFGSYQTLVSNHTVDVNNTDLAGIHWFELRKTGASWAMRQQGVYSPDANNRWMASAAMDTSGNIALGYSLSSSSTFPSIAYAGRNSNDALNTLNQGEVILQAGGGSQTHSSGRWGDYTSLMVDPLNDCTFWYTNEYYSTTSSASWKTRIGAFRNPTCSTFADVPVGAFAQNYIEGLYNAGITTGCIANPRSYCPNNTVTRAQMAVFLLRAKGVVPPAATGTVFSDVPLGSFGADYIEKLFSLGITGGCGVGKYCPNDNVTRAQMAVFLLRSKHGSAYTPPIPTGVFSDVPTNYWAAAWIEQLATEGITTGCAAGKYCPEDPVTRAQMAVFLVRTFSIPLP